ncbi:hypothetical protein QBC38DRAFT_504994 [Podospora fimiseda]|uniref:Uncharacterized protein n=1 Tax=Podospora fimiseda TaxID=252190 RepID=A0AAN6YL63_9PEZI|nr:hypothetical protein QBC38DRAFT_504994 [Podospora fimiseda]
MEQPAGRWGLHWRAATSMAIFFLAGLASAIGHHVFYSSLHKKVVIDTKDRWDLEAIRDGQEWKIRFGTAFAFLTQSLFAEAIDVAFQQTVWVAARQQSISIDGLDAMFSAGGTIWSYFKFEFLKKATLGAILGLLKWLIPFSALITPATLTVVQSNISTSSMMPVPSVNFSIVEPLYHWNMSNQQIDGAAATHDGITPYFNRLLSSTATSVQILPFKSVAPNSSYDLTFHEEAIYLMANASYRVSFHDGLPPGNPSFETKLPWLAFAPHNVVFELLALAERGKAPLKTSKDVRLNFLNFARHCIVVDPNSFKNTSIIGKELGQMSEPVCEGIIGFDPENPENVTHEYVSAINTALDLPRREPFNRGRLWIRVDNDTSYDCVLTDTEYTTRFYFSSSEGMQRIDPNYNFKYTEEDLHGSYFGIANALSNYLTGAMRVFSRGSGMVPFRTRVTESAIFGALNFNPLPGTDAPGLSERVLTPEVRDLARNKTVGELVEELSRNLTLSLFSAERVLDWNSTIANVTITSQANVHFYGSRNLIITYAVTCSFALTAVAVGVISLFRNGVSHQIGFLTFLLTTRNPRLDSLTIGESMGAMPHSKRVTDTKLRFGFIKGSYDDGRRETTRVGFGFEDEVEPLVKGMAYR